MFPNIKPAIIWTTWILIQYNQPWISSQLNNGTAISSEDRTGWLGDLKVKVDENKEIKAELKGLWIKSKSIKTRTEYIDAQYHTP